MFERLAGGLRSIWPFRTKQTGLQGLLLLGLPDGTVATINDETWPQAYEMCVWVFTCISKIASAVGSVPFIVSRRQKDGSWEPVEDRHPLSTMLEYVNSDQDASGLMELTAGWMGLYGNAYWQKLRPSPGALPEAVRVLPGNMVEAIPGRGKRSGVVQGYRIRAKDRPVLDDTDVVHFKLLGFNPIYGLPPIKPLEPIINMFSALTRYQYSLMAGGGIPATVLKLDKPHIDEKERKLYREMWLKWRSPDNADAFPLLLGSTMELEKLGVDPDQIGGLELNHQSRETIIGAYGVPPGVAGLLQDTNYNTMRFQRRTFWSETVSPVYLRKMASAMQEQMCWEYEKGTEKLGVQPDTSEVEALQEDKREEAEIGKIWVSAGIRTPNEVREDHGWEPLEGGDELRSGGGGGVGFSGSLDMETGDQKEEKAAEIAYEVQRALARGATFEEVIAAIGGAEHALSQ